MFRPPPDTTRPGTLLPSPTLFRSLDEPRRGLLDGILACSAIGSADTVKERLQAFVERTGADELMIVSQIFDHDARLRSYEITAGIHEGSEGVGQDRKSTRLNTSH